MTENSTPSFVHLKAHTEFSMSDGVLRIKDYVVRAKSLNFAAVAVSDRCNFFALVKFYRAAMSAGIKPLVGSDLLLKEGEEFYPFTAFCMNQKGYQNLTELISRAYTEGQEQGEPTVQWEWIEQASEGLIILSGAQQGDVGQALLSNTKGLATSRLERWLSVFNDRFYLELMRIGREQEEDYVHAAVALASQKNIPVVATNAVCFLDKEDFEAHEARVCIATGYVLEDSNRPRNYTEQQYLKSPEEMHELFSDVPEALENTVEIAKRCSMPLTLGEVFLPQFPLPEGVSLEHYIQQQSLEGLEKRFAARGRPSSEDFPEYEKRLAHELQVINSMGFPGYFLIVADFIQWSKSQGIPVGPGRGSGAGSLVAYALGITELDPIEHELLFERFLNPERVSMPDFDIDFCMEGRDRVIEYVAERYGREAVSQIITYGTMAAKAVVRDVGRVLAMPYGYVDKIAKLIPFEIGMTLDKALDQEAELKRLYKEEEPVTTLIDLAKKLEGITRNAGKHAGGVVIAPTKLTDFAPLYCEPGGEHVVTQFDKDDVEAVGLVKFDFLGLRTLTIINWALQAINKKRQALGEVPIDIETIPLDDAQSFELLHRCATTAVFQLESRGMKDLIRRLQPDTFEDIVALVALFRPGPLQSGMVDDFIDRKHGRAVVHYSHPSLEPILDTTYGVILYQEQVMQIAQVLAGYSLGGADILRRAMGKKKPEEMAKQREIFTTGSEERGIDKHVAEHIFDLMEKFAGYGFNKSHSAAYALIAYQTAYLKAHYPAEFMAAVLSSDMDNTDKVVGFLQECEAMELKVLSPSVNRGDYAFTVNENGEIEYGLGAVKGVGESAALHIVEERRKNGNYTDLFSFCQRLDLHKVNRRVLEPLIRSGSMDVFNVERATLAASVNSALKTADRKNRDAEHGQSSLFDMFDEAPGEKHQPEVEYVQAPIWTDLERLRGEKASLGTYISGHPLASYADEIANLTSITTADLPNVRREKVATIVGILVGVRRIMTKSGRRMAILTIEDAAGRIEITLFSKLLESLESELIEDTVYVIKGKVEDDDFSGGVRMLGESVESIDTVREQLAKRLLIDVADQTQIEKVLADLPEVIKPYCGGGCPIALRYKNDSARAELELGSEWCVTLSDELMQKLKHFCGNEHVILEY